MKKYLLVLFLLIASVSFGQLTPIYPTSKGKLVGNWLWMGLSADSLWRLHLSQNGDSIVVNNRQVSLGGATTWTDNGNSKQTSTTDTVAANVLFAPALTSDALGRTSLYLNPNSSFFLKATDGVTETGLSGEISVPSVGLSVNMPTGNRTVTLDSNGLASTYVGLNLGTTLVPWDTIFYNTLYPPVTSSQWTTEADGIFYNGKVAVGLANVSATDSALQCTSASFTRGVKTGYDINVNGITVGKGNRSVATNTAMGVNSLQSNTTGWGNTSVGYNTLSSATTGIRNTAVGDSALTKLNTGKGNTSVGHMAGHSTTTGFSNVAIGESALYSNSTGRHSVAVGDSALYRSTGVGNTGLGSKAGYLTTSATYNLAIGFRALYSNSTTSNQMAIGDSALYSQTTTTGQNIAIGGKAMAYATSNRYCLAVGYQAMRDATSSRYNTAIGYDALRLTQSMYNTALGYQAGYNGGGGDNNTAIGYQALYTNPGGNGDNTAVGSGAMYANNTGYLNTAIGRSAMGAATSGYSNVAIGYQSLNNNTTGNSNISIGSSSLTANTTGINNVAVGHNSLTAATANSNTGIGSSALLGTTSGYSNTSVGILSLRSNTTGHNNIALGDSAGYSYTTLSNRMYLGARDSTTTGIFFNRTAAINKGYWNGKLNVKTIPYSASPALKVMAQDTVTGDVYRTAVSIPASTWTDNGSEKQTSTTDTAYATYLKAFGVLTTGINVGSQSIINETSGGMLSTSTSQTTGNGGTIAIGTLISPEVSLTAYTSFNGNAVGLDTASLYPSNGVPLNLGKSTTPFDTTFTNKLKVGGYNVTVTADCSIPLPKADGSTNGFLSSSDWTAFNNKVSSPWLTNSTDVYYTAGKVGINTSSPGTSLDVNGTITTPNLLGGTAAGSGITYTSTSGTGTAAGIAHHFKSGTNGGTSDMVILNNGKIGIGLTNPTYDFQLGPNLILEVAQDVRAANSITAGYFSGYGLVSMWGASKNTINFVCNSDNSGTDGVIRFGKNGYVSMATEFARFNDGGSLGIGTTAPSSKLHVSGTSRLGNVRADSTKVNGLFYLPNIDKDTLKRDGHILAWDSVNGKVMAQHDLKLGSGGDTITLDKVNGLRLYGTATMWDDLMFPFSTGLAGGASYPVNVPDSGYYTFVVDSTGVTKCIQYMTVQLPHRWKEGSNLYFHVHYKHETAVGTPNFIVKYRWANVGAVVQPLAWNWQRLGTTTGTTDKTHQMAYNSAGISGAGKTLSSLLFVQVYLRTTPANVNAYQFDIHYEIDSMGSKEEIIK